MHPSCTKIILLLESLSLAKEQHFMRTGSAILLISERDFSKIGQCLTWRALKLICLLPPRLLVSGRTARCMVTIGQKQLKLEFHTVINSSVLLR